ncbi:MAG: hypothetical protein PWR21_137 [Methanoculleus sp.]|nr:hypothetical protein [Methanoculleus sp.]
MYSSGGVWQSYVGRGFAGLRDISIHSYYAVKPTILREIIRTELGPLEDGG